MSATLFFSSNGQGFILSIALHSIFIVFLYFIKSGSLAGSDVGQSYKIFLQASRSCVSQAQELPQKACAQEGMPLHPLKSRRAVHAKNSVNSHLFGSNQVSKSKKISYEKAEKAAQMDKNFKIDERGLYKTTQNSSKEAGATLELKGWEWNALPEPNDATEEFGRIVFQIKVDTDGEIISIQTLEKTVTPMVEKIYADALRLLTFSKTTDGVTTVSTGKVTFVLVPK